MSKATRASILRLSMAPFNSLRTVPSFMFFLLDRWVMGLYCAAHCRDNTALYSRFRHDYPVNSGQTPGVSIPCCQINILDCVRPALLCILSRHYSIGRCVLYIVLGGCVMVASQQIENHIATLEHSVEVGLAYFQGPGGQARV